MRLKKRIKQIERMIKRNPPDSTPRNIRASQRRDDELTQGLKHLSDRVYKCEQRLESLEMMPKIGNALPVRRRKKTRRTK